MTNTLKLALELAPKIEKETEKKISIPAISSAIFGFPLSDCAQIFAKSVFKFVIDMAEEDRKVLPEIVLCNIMDDTVVEFRKQFDLEFSKLETEEEEGKETEKTPEETPEEKS